MKEQFVSFETAKLAKEKGFVSGGKHSYVQYHTDYVYDGDINHPESHKDGDIKETNHQYHSNHVDFDISNENFSIYEMPTQSLLQKWLREEHQIIIDIATDCTSEPKYVYSIHVFKGNPRDLAEKEWGWYFHKQEDWCLDYTYENALEAGLKEAISLINKELKFE